MKSSRHPSAGDARRHRHLGPKARQQPQPDAAITEPSALLDRLDALTTEVRREGVEKFARWNIGDVPGLASCAANLADYLALRGHDLRPIQRGLTMLGLSSLGRSEGHVLPALQATRAALAAIVGRQPDERPPSEAFFAGERCLTERRQALFGATGDLRATAIMVTCPSEAAEDPAFMRDLADRRIEALRINCAHDGPRRWLRMFEHARVAEQETGHRMRIFMDLAGPKIRTGNMEGGGGRLHVGDRLRIVEAGALGAHKTDEAVTAVECTLAEAVRGSRTGDHVFYNDGKLGGVIEEAGDDGLLVHIEQAPEKGARLKPEKGLNFPDADLGIAALTKKDRRDLKFIAAHADGVQYSFVQSAADVMQLQEALAELRDDWQKLALVLKVETIRAIDNLPEIMVHAASRQPTAVMIARGDLAVEIGFARMAEMQEEILWLAEAAHVPVIWATQVLENLVKKGRPSRGEMTDAAMAARAECVMLNKGPHVLEAIEVLDTLLGRMGEHQHKKTPQLRALKSW